VLTLWLFWLSAAGVFYAFAGYPILLLVLSRLRRRPIRAGVYVPHVSIIIAVHDEEANIGRKLDNLLDLDYPREKLEIIVVSDDSGDATNRLVADYADRGVVLLELPIRGGKHLAQKLGIERAQGEILAFTDAAPILDRQALAKMVEYFADPEVGCVSSEDRVLSESIPTGEEHNYIRHLMALRRLETGLGSVVGLSGSFFAARRELCKPWWTDRSSDFFLALEAVRRGLRAVHHPASIHYYRVTQSIGSEFVRKRRTALNGLVVLFTSLDLANPFRYGIFSFQLLSHKLCRFTAPFLLLLMLVANVRLAMDSTFFQLTLAVQVFLYLAAGLAVLIPRLARVPAVRTVVFFAIGNAAMLLAWYDLTRGRTLTIWSPTRRP